MSSVNFYAYPRSSPDRFLQSLAALTGGTTSWDSTMRSGSAEEALSAAMAAQAPGPQVLRALSSSSGELAGGGFDARLSAELVRVVSLHQALQA